MRNTMRICLRGTTCLVFAGALLAQSGDLSGHIQAQRLWGTLEKLSEYGRPAGAGFEGGVTRLGFSKERSEERRVGKECRL